MGAEGCNYDGNGERAKSGHALSMGYRERVSLIRFPTLQQWLRCVTWVACAGVFFLFKMSSAGCTSGDEAFMNLGNAIPVMGTMQAGQRMASLGKH